MNLRGKLTRLVDNAYTLPGKIFDYTIQLLIIISIISLLSFSVETFPGLSVGIGRLLKLVEAVTVAVFTVEYLLRIYVAGNRFCYIFSFPGIVDLLAGALTRVREEESHEGRH